MQTFEKSITSDYFEISATGVFNRLTKRIPNVAALVGCNRGV